MPGIELWNFWGALILLGLGWNFGFIGSHRDRRRQLSPAARPTRCRASTTSSCSAPWRSSRSASGKVFNAYGWACINLVVLAGDRSSALFSRR